MEETDAGWPDLVAAFAHELRTPLSTISMVVQLCQMSAGEDGEVQLDAELVSMLRSSTASIVELTDGLQEAARLARGRTRARPERILLSRVIAEVLDHTPEFAVETEGEFEIEGLWDGALLARALAELVRSANRAGDNSGRVVMHGGIADLVEVRLTSGRLRGDESEVEEPGMTSNAAAFGPGFYYARLQLRGMGGDVTFVRGPQRCCLRVALPAGL